MLGTLWKSAAILLAALVSAPACAATWMRADTHNFILYSSGSESQLREYATKLEKFDAALRFLLNLPKDANPNRLEIYLVADADDVGRLHGDQHTAGFYSPSLDGSFAIANRDRKANKFALDGLTVLFHEYAHHMMYRNFNYSYPTWFSEGFAEYVSTMQFNNDGSWTYGFPAFHRNYDLVADTRSYPVDAMVYNELKGRASNRYGLYAFGWLTVHMLFSTPEYRKKLDTYLRAFGQGTPPRVAATEAFGDMKAFKATVNKYRGGKLIYKKSTMPLDYETAMAISTLNADDSKLVELTMARKSSTNPVRTRNGLAALSAKFPNNANIALELAYAEHEVVLEEYRAARKAALAAKGEAKPPVAEGEEEDEEEDDFDVDPKRYAAAFAALDRAIALNPAQRRALDFKGRLMIETLPGDDKDGWKKARGYISAANRLSPDDPAPLFDYYMSFRRQGVTVPKAAKDALAQAFGTIPEVNEVTFEYAFALAEEGQYRAAENLLKTIAFNPHAGGSLAPLHALAEMERAKLGSTPIDAELKALETATAEAEPAKK
ncbi:hypothetical protein GCM10011614_11870 [Novosphingobium colocasiae]|uniref:DUF1570 domain-containing protein n=1 Tax=Novosphingobium colocasiae TaxID=1256513 RepID=A0A918UDW6_9SPHN|nr:hypothetical protein GCM10011614_11870 [Novosphingobium colocasiae]